MNLGLKIGQKEGKRKWSTLDIHEHHPAPVWWPVKCVSGPQGSVPLALRGRQEPPVTPEAAEVVVGDGLEDVAWGQVPDLNTGRGAESEKEGRMQQQRGCEPFDKCSEMAPLYIVLAAQVWILAFLS